MSQVIGVVNNYKEGDAKGRDVEKQPERDRF